MSAQQVKSSVCVWVEENRTFPVLTELWSHVVTEGSHPSEDMTSGPQAVLNQEAEALTAQRKRELEHYLKLKRYSVFVGLARGEDILSGVAQLSLVQPHWISSLS